MISGTNITERIRVIAVPIIGVALIGLAGHLNPQITELRLLNTSTNPRMEQSTSLPPVIAFITIGMAGFRGIAADMLWLRAGKLQEDQRFFELVQLADLITALEPRFPQVWAFQAWNMAYNISVLMPMAEDRWRWVQNGIELLRDRGLRFNPDNPRLYYELGWIYHHKIGGDSDSAAKYYRLELGKKIMAAEVSSGYIDYAALAASSEQLNALLDLGLNPEIMKQVDQQYGPLDWRAPETHALYWSHQGMLVDDPNHRASSCEQLVCKSLAALVTHGKLTYSEEGNMFVTSPNFDLLPQAIATFEEALKRDRMDIQANAYKEFLATMVGTLRFFYKNDEAREIFDILHSHFPSPETAGGYENFTTRQMARLPQIITDSSEEEP